MFFVLSKTIYVLAMPVTWLLLVAGGALLMRRPVWKKRMLRLLLAMMLLFTNPFIINELFLLWEAPPTPFAQVTQVYEVAVVLSGFTHDDKLPADRTYLNKSADRLMYAMRLYKEGKVKKILICGTESGYADEVAGVRRSSKGLLLLCGVPDSAVLIESASRNTRENALNAAQVLNKDFPNQKYLLITSAFHMRRAKGCFEKVGIPVDTFSADFSSKERLSKPGDLVPNEEAFYKWGILIHEVVGYVTYDLVGYL